MCFDKLYFTREDYVQVPVDGKIILQVQEQVQ